MIIKKIECSNVVSVIEGETSFDPKKVANCFNNFFKTVAVKILFIRNCTNQILLKVLEQTISLLDL